MLIFHIFFWLFLFFIWGGWSSRIASNKQTWKILTSNRTNRLGQDRPGDPHYELPDNLQVWYVECVSLTTSYPLFFLSNSQVSSMLHHDSVRWFHSQECYLNSVHHPLIFTAGKEEKGLNLQTSFEKGRNWQDVKFLGGFLGKRGWLFSGGL